MKSISLIPYVCGAGASTYGCQDGPNFLKEQGLLEALQQRGFQAEWSKFFPVRSPDKPEEEVYYHCEKLAEAVEEAVKQGRFPFTLGGDHSMGMGSISGLARATSAHERIGVIWIDAHLDAHTMDTSPSQSIHGMPIAHLLGHGVERLKNLSGKDKTIAPEHICYIGARSFEDGEHNLLKEHGVKIFYIEDLKEMGMKNVMAEAYGHMAEQTDYRFLSFDIDGLEPDLAPAVGTPVDNGINRTELDAFIEAIAHGFTFDGMEITEFNPHLEGAEKTAKFIIKLCGDLLEANEKGQQKDLKKAI